MTHHLKENRTAISKSLVVSPGDLREVDGKVLQKMVLGSKHDALGTVH